MVVAVEERTIRTTLLIVNFGADTWYGWGHSGVGERCSEVGRSCQTVPWGSSLFPSPSPDICTGERVATALHCSEA